MNVADGETVRPALLGARMMFVSSVALTSDFRRNAPPKTVLKKVAALFCCALPCDGKTRSVVAEFMCDIYSDYFELIGWK
jgi:hypothetical protein